ncbi:MAG: hypothetical protein HY854_16080 [Burkholderiales bacterium]|nr:hypothetical protein [Burkholderiales bacterium]
MPATARTPQKIPRLQPAQPFELAFGLPARADFTTLDRWLRDVLGVQWEDPDIAPDLEAPEGVAAWLWRALLLARTLLQATRLPVFDVPGIEALRSEPSGEWHARVRMPAIEYVAPQCVQLALQSALGLCDWMGARAPDEPAVAALHDMLDKEVLPRLGTFVVTGKSTLPVLRAAHALGIPALHLGSGVFQLGWGSRARRIDRSMTDRDSAIGVRLAQDKVATARLLAAAGLPVPLHALARSTEQAAAVARELGTPVVVKPSNQDRGAGVSMDVADTASLDAAFRHAKQVAPDSAVLVERQVPGWCHRLFVWHGKLLYAVKRLPAGVYADGEHSIGQLAAAACAADQRKPSWQRVGAVTLDDLALASLQRMGWTPASVPPAGTFVPLRRIESTQWGGTDEDVTATLHPDNVQAAVRATALMGLEVAGVDMIGEDLSQPWHASGAVINEVNAAPLLGGGDISRGYLPEFLSRLLGEGLGRIPVEVIADEARATRRWKALCKEGLRCWRVEPVGVRDPAGELVPMTAAGTAQRVRALLLDGAVDAIIVSSDFVMPGLTRHPSAAAPKPTRRRR